MRKLVLVSAVAALAAPIAALAADPPPSEGPSAAQACAAERTAIGDALFRQTHGTNANKSNAFGKCVAKKTQEANVNHANAATQCRPEQRDANFAASHGGKTFDQFYATGNSGKNAFGRCVSSKAQADAAGQSQATLNAAKKCKAERAANPAAFKARYGTNNDKSNAFGKCVSQKVKPA
jgi:hypothetical protein